MFVYTYRSEIKGIFPILQFIAFIRRKSSNNENSYKIDIFLFGIICIGIFVFLKAMIHLKFIHQASQTKRNVGKQYLEKYVFDHNLIRYDHWQTHSVSLQSLFRYCRIIANGYASFDNGHSYARAIEVNCHNVSLLSRSFIV